MASVTIPPLMFRPILKERVWGGRRLREFGQPVPADARIGEAWLLADLPGETADGESSIVGGAWDGQSIGTLLATHRVALLGVARASGSGRFPLLIKLLDAESNLSVQVHPTPEYMRTDPAAHVKNEAWIVLRADPGALLHIGLRQGTDRATFLRCARDGSIERALIPVAARVGDCHVLPSGICHALGAGVVVAEIQTPSDTTFRVYDWGRTGRELHLEEAADCIYGVGSAPDALPLVAPLPTIGGSSDRGAIHAGALRSRQLASTPDFSIERIAARTESRLPIVTDGQAVIFIGETGDALLSAPGTSLLGTPPPEASSEGPAPPDISSIALAPGNLVLVPACVRGAELRLRSGTSVLRVDLPSPMDSMVAGEG